MRFLVEAHQRPVRRSCGYVGLARSAWYEPPLGWTVRDAEIIGALGRLVEERPSRGSSQCGQILRREHRRNHKRISRVFTGMRLNLRRAARRHLRKREQVPPYVPRTPDEV